MKRVLIVGKHSYIGTSVEKMLKKWPDRYTVDTVDSRNGAWKEHSFVGYDSALHVAGIAHVTKEHESKELYLCVNRNLAIDVAEKAKSEGVKQFILMSSIIVYGDSGYINQKRIIDQNTIPKPTNSYGESKLQAEMGVGLLEDEGFKVVILRPPMVYGKGCKGNYVRLSKIAQKIPLFPDIRNERSMLHIDNLCQFIQYMIDNEEHGVFFPQNAEYVRTSEMVRLIADAHGKRVRLTRLVNPILLLMGCRISTFKKIFGNFVYDQRISEYKADYRIRDLRESIELTEA